MSNEPRNLTRNQLAEFLPNQRAIRAMEQILKTTNEVLPDQIAVLTRLVEETLTEATNGSSQAQEALSIIQSSMQDASIAIENAESKAAQAVTLLSTLQRIADALEQRPPESKNNSITTDYIDFGGINDHVNVARRIAWNNDEETLDVHHSTGVTQQVGYELYAFVVNNTGATLNDGEVVYIVSSNGSYPTAAKFLSDGNTLGQRCIGVLTESIPNGGKGRANIYGLVRDINASGSLVSETWAAGDALYASPTVSGGITKTKPTAPNLAIPLGFVVNNSSTVGSIFVRTVIEQQKFYGSFSKTANVSPLAANTAYTIVFDTTIISSGVTLGTPASRIVIANSGLYAFSTSYQWASTSASVKNVWLFYRKNGVDIPSSSLKISLESANALSTPSRRRVLSLVAGDYIEICYAADSTNATLTNIASTAFAPSAPACIVTVEQIQQ